jgi:DNA-binding XRE family transcriptional regulator
MKGQDILLRRNERRVNQEPLAKELGIHPMILTAAEKGYWQPADAEIERAFRAIEKLAEMGQEVSA